MWCAVFSTLLSFSPLSFRRRFLGTANVIPQTRQRRATTGCGTTAAVGIKGPKTGGQYKNTQPTNRTTAADEWFVRKI